MAAIFKSLFKGKKSAKEKALEEDSVWNGVKKGCLKETQCNFDNDKTSATAAYHTEVKPRMFHGPRSYHGGERPDRDNYTDNFHKSFNDLRHLKEEEKVVYRSSKRSSRRALRADLNYDKRSATAAYRTESKPRMYKGPRSCPGDENSEEYDRFDDTYNRLANREMQHRRGFSKNGRCRYITSDYDSGELSSNFLYDTTLDDSEAEDIFLERKKQRVHELEKALYDNRLKVKKYKEVIKGFKGENEKISRRCEKLEAEREKSAADRKRLAKTVLELQTKLSLLENQQEGYSSSVPMAAPLMLGSLPENREPFCQTVRSTLPSVPPPLDFNYGVRHNNSEKGNSDEMDEVKVFRRCDTGDLELPRDVQTPDFMDVKRPHDSTVLRQDIIEDYCKIDESVPASLKRRALSDTALQKL